MSAIQPLPLSYVYIYMPPLFVTSLVVGILLELRDATAVFQHWMLSGSFGDSLWSEEHQDFGD